jgi:hypothetical protein
MKKKILIVLLLGVISTSLTGCLPGLFPDTNNPPVISHIPDASITLSETFTYTVEAADPDGDDLTYSLTTNPSTNMAIGENSGAITWTPFVTGSYDVVVEVSDGKLSDIQSFSIIVSEPPNQAPVITSTPVTSIILGETYTYIVEATDSEGDDLTYTLITKPTDMTISTAGVISWTPTATGSEDVVVEVSDGNLSDSQSFTVTVDKALLVSIEVLPSTMTIEIGDSEAITSVTAHYDNGTEANITPLTACTYESDKINATVSLDGVVTGVSSCTAATPVTITVTYTEDSITVTDTVSVVVTNPSPG